MSLLYNKIVVKVGSNVLTREDGMLNVTMMAHIVDQIVSLRKAGTQVILVHPVLGDTSNCIFGLEVVQGIVISRQGDVE